MLLMCNVLHEAKGASDVLQSSKLHYIKQQILLKPLLRSYECIDWSKIQAISLRIRSIF